MKIIAIYLCLFNFVIFSNCADRNPRNLFTDFVNNLLPDRYGSQATFSCECGLDGQRSGRVVNGSDAKPFSQPWQAALFFEATKQQFCSATLINSRWLGEVKTILIGILTNSKSLVTAYHCLMEQTVTSLRVILGTSKLNEKQIAKPSYTRALTNEKPGLLEAREYKKSILELLYRLDESGKKTLLFEWGQLNPFNIDAVQFFRVKSLIQNKEFEKSWFKNDIALIELEQDVKFSDAIRPICLFDTSLFSDNRYRVENEENEENNLLKKLVTKELGDKRNELKTSISEFEVEERWFAKRIFEAYGFGRIGYNQVGSTKLQKATFQYQRLEECKKIWETKIPYFGGLIDESQMCVRDQYSTICHGDSGTGLILPLDDSTSQIDVSKLHNQKIKNYLVGVASAGYYCQKEVPSIFTRVNRQLEFIHSNVNSGYWCSK